MQGEDWARLCRMYREKFGLKQDAFAYDFNVTQSTVSRWEAGKRIPNERARKRILVALNENCLISNEDMTGHFLRNSQMRIAVWDENGCLVSMSPCFAEELQSFVGQGDVTGKSADALAENFGIMRFALRVFRQQRFFDCEIASASLRHKPFGTPQRIAMGGVYVTTVLPTMLTTGRVGMFCIYEHDALGHTPPYTLLETLDMAGNRALFEDLPTVPERAKTGALAEARMGQA